MGSAATIAPDQEHADEERGRQVVEHVDEAEAQGSAQESVLGARPGGRIRASVAVRRWRNGTSAIAFEPLDFLARLAALVPRPRAHLLTYHGVLAPAAVWREFIVPRSSAAASCTHSASHGEQPPRPSAEFEPTVTARSLKRPTRSTWAQLMLRAFAIDVLTCDHCGGRRRLIAFLTDGLVVRKILAHLGLATEPPQLAPARAPPEFEFAE